jgi:hypothetical protein
MIVAAIYQTLQNWVLTWIPVLFLGAIVFFMWRTLKVMPRTKPQQIKPETKQSIGWNDIAGVDEAKHELQEVVEFLRDPKRFKALGAKVPKGILCTARPAPERPCWPRPWRPSRRQTSSPSRQPRSSRCSPDWARPGSGGCSRSPASTPPR